MSSPPAYMALALQVGCSAVSHDEDNEVARVRMAASIARVGAQVAACKRFIGDDLRLVALPEYFLTGFPMGASAEAWAEKAALASDGPEYAALGAIAQAGDLWLAGNAYERDAHFPGLYFQTSFIIGPDAAVGLRYRRLISMFSPSPYDLIDRYLDLYGAEALFPVWETPIGRLAAIASEEILYPEIARAHALRGAEVFVHASSEAGSLSPTPKHVARQARAIENLAYVVSANSGGIDDIAIPRASTDGRSSVIDYRGAVLAEAAFGESMVAHAQIDLAALRRWRRRPGMANLLARQPLALWARAYEAPEIQAANSLIDDTGAVRSPGPGWYAERQRRVIERLDARGLI